MGETDKKYDSVEKLSDNPYLNLYHINARTDQGKPFDYYFASRNDEIQIKHKTHSMKPEGMAIYAVRKEEPDKIVLLRQYRYPLNDYVYELPAGLVEEGETPAQAAVREMEEETGLALTVYEGGQTYYRRPFFLAQGFSDESGCMIFGTASGSICTDKQEDSEDIEVIFADKEEVRRILSQERVSIRAGFLLMQFLQMKEDAPFAFLEG